MTKGLEAQIVVHRGPDFTLDLRLDIAPGRTAALLGPNGSGKSTTVDVLAGILPVDEGRLSLESRCLDDPALGVFVEPEHRRVGVVFQRYLLFDHLDVLDNVGFAVACKGESRKQARVAAEQWLNRFGLTALANVRPPALSGGQAQRVALARALASEPELLLLDEPLAALDIATRTGLRRTLVEHLKHYAGPRLLITHDPTDAFLLADEVHILEDGCITQTGTPDDLRRRPATPYVAALAGLNLLSGQNSGGLLTLDATSVANGGGATLQSADTGTNGAVLITIHPNAIALHAEQPHGSPRNTWQTTVAALEPLGDITRVTLHGPLELFADITPGAAAALELRAGSPVWVSIKATEISLDPA